VAWRADRIIKLVVMAAVVVVVGLMLHRAYRHFRGIEVCVRNVDNQPLRSGEVTVTSSLSTRRYSIGDLSPAGRSCVWVKADNEAGVDVTFAIPGDKSKTIPLDGYIEPGYSGSISAEVTAQGARDIKRDIEPF
jgi:hypothetical protein